MIRRISSIRDVRSLVGIDAPAPTADRLFEIVASSGAILDGHFKLQSGRHSQYLLRFRQIGRHEGAPEAIAEMLLQRLQLPPSRRTVICPESAGYFLGKAIAAATNSDLAVAKIDGLRRPSSALRSGEITTKEAIVVNDIVTTGDSLLPLFDLAKEQSVKVVAVLAFAAFSSSTFYKFMNERSVAGAYLASNAWSTCDDSACDLCNQQVELIPAAEFN